MKSVTTVLVDYDGTIHDWDGVFKRSLNGVLGLSGKEFFEIWTYKIHREIIHKKYLNKHDDLKFHCNLLFNYLGKSYDEKASQKIVHLIKQAREKAKNKPEYFFDALPTLKKLKEIGLTLCLSTGLGVELKAETMRKITGKNFFTHLFSEPLIGCLKTEPEYYLRVLRRAKVASKEAVSIGDTPLSDILPAKLVNMTSIWLNRRGEKWPKNVPEKPDYTVRTLTEALELF